MAKDLDEIDADFRDRPLDAGPYTYVWADALTMKVAVAGPVDRIPVHEDDQAALAALVIAAPNQISYELGRLRPGPAKAERRHDLHDPRM